MQHRAEIYWLLALKEIFTDILLPCSSPMQIKCQELSVSLGSDHPGLVSWAGRRLSEHRVPVHLQMGRSDVTSQSCAREHVASVTGLIATGTSANSLLMSGPNTELMSPPDSHITDYTYEH